MHIYIHIIYIHTKIYISDKLHHVCRPPPATATNQNQPTKYNHQIPTTTTIDNNNRYNNRYIIYNNNNNIN